MRTRRHRRRHRRRRTRRRQGGGLVKRTLDLYERLFERPLPDQATAKHDEKQQSPPASFDSVQKEYDAQRVAEAKRLALSLTAKERRDNFAELTRKKKSSSFEPLVLPRDMLQRSYRAISSDCKPLGNPVEYSEVIDQLKTYAATAEVSEIKPQLRCSAPVIPIDFLIRGGVTNGKHNYYVPPYKIGTNITFDFSSGQMQDEDYVPDPYVPYEDFVKAASSA